MKRTFKRIPHKAMRYLKHASPTILTVTAAIGVVATAVMAVKATPKALTLLEEAETDKGEELTKIEVVRVAAVTYVPAAAVGISTIACLFGANVLNKRQQSALVSAYALLDTSFKEYKSKVCELYGKDADEKIETEIAKDRLPEENSEPSDGKRLFYERHYGYFEATNEDVLAAEYAMNHDMATCGFCTLNDFYHCLKLKPKKSGDTIGWSFDMLLTDYDYVWIDFEHENVVMDDGLEVCIISTPIPPSVHYKDEWI